MIQPSPYRRPFEVLLEPQNIRARLIAAMWGVRAARWQNDEQLHRTLRLIGEVDRPIAEDVVAALGSVHAPPITATIAGVGRFEKRGRTDAIWAGVAPGDARNRSGQVCLPKSSPMSKPERKIGRAHV